MPFTQQRKQISTYPRCLASVSREKGKTQQNQREENLEKEGHHVSLVSLQSLRVLNQFAARLGT